MQTSRFLHKILADSAAVIHTQRFKALLATVQALLKGQRLGLTALGRAMPGETPPKHTIKRVDRLLGNAHMHQERPLFYATMTRHLLGNMPHPCILVDWSPIDDRGRHFLLRAAIPFANRSFPIYERVHYKEECPICERHLLDALALVLPQDTKPILITDAGFRSPWRQEVEKRGWYYVSRLRRPSRYRFEGQDWQPIDVLFAGASRTPEALGSVELTKGAPLQTWLYRVRHRNKGRKHLNKHGNASGNKRSRKAAKGNREPWILASNLPITSRTAEKVVSIYRQRMQIEEGFRDIKSSLFGLGFRMHQTRRAQRIEVLLLIAMLANFVILACGLQVRQAGNIRYYQSNSIRQRMALSLWRIGREALDRLKSVQPRSLTRLMHQEACKQAIV